MRKFALMLVITMMMYGGFSTTAAQEPDRGFRPRQFNPFSVRPTVDRGFGLRNFGIGRNNPFSPMSLVDPLPEVVTPLAVLTAAEESLTPAFGGSGRPPYTPPVRSPFRPTPRPPFGP
jgi:hypothetical protein